MSSQDSPESLAVSKVPLFKSLQYADLMSLLFFVEQKSFKKDENLFDKGDEDIETEDIDKSELNQIIKLKTSLLDKLSKNFDSFSFSLFAYYLSVICLLFAGVGVLIALTNCCLITNVNVLVRYFRIGKSSCVYGLVHFCTIDVDDFECCDRYKITGGHNESFTLC